MEELLRFEHVSFAYEDGAERRLALRDCSVSIGAGERIAVLGSNGAGKSTFFLLANGVLCPKEGAVFFHGEPVGRKKQELNRLRRGVGLVFQDPDVQILGGTVEEEISFGPMNLGLPRQEVRRRMDSAVERMRLEDLRQRAPQYLSGGEKKLVSVVIDAEEGEARKKQSPGITLVLNGGDREPFEIGRELGIDPAYAQIRDGNMRIIRK